MGDIHQENGLTARMAQFVCRANYSDIPHDVVEYTKVLIADSLACGFGASVLPGARHFVKVPEAMGGPEQAVILTTGKKVSAAAAAFANSYLINALDADDTFYTTCHPLASVFASALAVAEEVGASGKALIAAVAIGYDVAIRCKRSILKTRQGSMGWFVMGAVAAAANLYRLTEEQTAMAFSIAAFGSPHANGRWNQMGSGRRHDMKYWANHYTAFAAVTAAQFAKAGLTSDRTIFDGEPNYAHFIGFDGIDEQLMFEDIGKRWWIAETSIKPWAVCRYSQISITLIKEIMAEHGLQPNDIEQIRVQTWDFIASPWFCDNIEITNEYDAQFSFPHAVAAAGILGWEMGPEWQAAAVRNPMLDDLARKISITPNPRYEQDSVLTNEGNKYMATVVDVVTRGGTFRKEGGTALGDPFDEKYKLDMDRIWEKYRIFSQPTLDHEAMDRTFSRIRMLEDLPNVQFKLTV
ncbi:MAG: MmgE/PrpD family protein [Azoarcus sp.]|jgi:2-methylcitrate dehydratase PrpD|nr:MmgE/PrpD family protein [Azoarcus sp.]